MIETRPRVFLIAQPQIVTAEMLSYLREVGGGEWWDRVGAKIALGDVPAAEGLIEFAGRMCYRSWSPGLNANVTKVRKDRDEYITNVLRSGHGSVLMHANFTFALRDISRVATVELNRHTAGTAVSEQSLRYVRLDELRFRVPELLRPETQRVGRELVATIERGIAEMMELEGLDDPRLDFGQKKTITSALRRWAPLGLSTEETWTANIRAIRHVIEMRTDAAAEEEIRDIAWQIYKVMAEACPLLFADYVETSNVEGELTTEFRKV